LSNTKKEEYDESFPFDEWTLASGRVKYNEKGEFVLFDTEVRNSTWNDCPITDPTFEDLQVPRIRKAVKNWYRKCLCTEREFNPEEVNLGHKLNRRPKSIPSKTARTQDEISFRDKSQDDPNSKGRNKEGGSNDKRSDKGNPNPKGDKEGDSKASHQDDGKDKGDQKASNWLDEFYERSPEVQT
jgi:Mg-chelatase subunit ChlI